MQITLKEIAELAQVSEATVSRVLNNSRLISEKTRAVVLDAARKLNYQLNRASLIGVVEPKITNPTFSEILTAIEEQVYRAGFGMILCNSAYDLLREEDQLNFLLHLRGVQGMILIPIDAEAAHIRALGQQNLPHVLIGTYADIATDQINVDAALGAYTMTCHLLAFGHRRIGLLLGPQYIQGCRERHKGYRQALDEYHIPFDSALVGTGGIDEYGGAQAIDQLLPRIPAEITAVLTISDTMALGALHRLREANIHVPGDLSLAVCDELAVAAQIHPALTTLWQPKPEIGKLAAKLLLKQIETHNERGDDWKTLYPFQSTLYQPQIIPRESTRQRLFMKADPLVGA